MDFHLLSCDFLIISFYKLAMAEKQKTFCTERSDPCIVVILELHGVVLLVLEVFQSDT